VTLIIYFLYGMYYITKKIRVNFARQSMGKLPVFSRARRGNKEWAP